MSYMYHYTKRVFLLLFTVLGFQQAMAQSPAITSQPSNQLVCPGVNATFTVTANNATTYQWQVDNGSGFTALSNGAPYSGVTTANLSITGVTAGMNGYIYRCVVSGITPPNAVSNSATLNVDIPTVTGQPVDAAACAGANASFSIAATGSNLVYQWQENQGAGFVNIVNGGMYSGANTATLSLTGVTAGMAGYTYRCNITGSCSSSATSNTVSLSITPSPTVTAQPVASTICENGTTTFSITASNATSYQWFQNSGSGFVPVNNAGVISGATTSTLTITGATAAMNGYIYKCAAIGSCSPADTSATAALTVNALAVITTQPTSVAACATTNTSFSVVATGAGLTYQWQENQGAGFVNVTNGGVYSGATTATLNLTGVTAVMNGRTYQCIITNATCPVTSSIATLTVNTAPVVTTQPVNSVICQNANTTFSVVATGTGLTYQWQSSNGGPFTNVVDGGVYSGATSATLTITGATAAMNGTVYHCNVTGTCLPAVASNNATLTVNPLPTITTQPTNPAAVCVGSNINIQIIAAGVGLTYQWQVDQGAGFVNVVNGGNYSGATTATLAITAATAAFNGNIYRCIVTTGAGCTVTSNSVTTTVNSSPTIITQPSNTSVCIGGTANATVVATGAGLTYQWQAFILGTWTNLVNGTLLGTNFSGVTTPTLSITNAAALINNLNIRVIVTGTCAPAATSSTAIVTINNAPAVTGQPVNRTVCENGTTTYAVTATGTGLTYQWQENSGTGFVDIVNGGIYSNATTATLTLTGIPIANNGYTYRCVVSGTCTPAATSNAASLTVNALPAITTGPSPVTICATTSTSFSVTATGAGLTYQWQVSTNGGVSYSNLTNVAPYSNVTTATMNITNATVALNNNLYQVVVSGTCTPAVTSTSALLTVNAATAITAQPVAAAACAGNNATFSVTAAGTNLSYQWEVNTGSGFLPIIDTGIYSGSATASLTITGTNTTLNGYQYHCIVTGSCAPISVTSNAAALTVNTAPSITTNPASVAVCSGTNVNFTVVATGSGLTYQWQRSTNGGVTFTNLANGGQFSNVTLSTMTITGVLAGNNGQIFRCVVTGTCAPAATSTGATLTINGAVPVISTQPTSVTTCQGNTVSYTVAATTGSFTYQWQVSTTGVGGPWVNVANGGTNPTISGATAATLTLAGVTTAIGGNVYRVIVRSLCPPNNTTTSNVVALTLNTPVITANPVNTSICVGANASFSVTTTGANLTYQWQANDGNGYFNLFDTGVFTGTNTAVLNITGTPDSLDAYTFRCVVSGLCGLDAISTGATFTVSTTTNWTGLLSNLWSDPGNWGCGSLPTAQTDVVIPTGTPNNPVVDIPTAVAHDVTIAASAQLSFQLGSILDVKGSIFPNSSSLFDPSQGTVIFSGSAQQYVPSANYLNLTMKNTGKKKLTGSAVVGNQLSLINGLFIIGNFNLTLGPSTTIFAGGPASYIVTDGTGMVIDQNIGAGGKVSFEKLPVGPTISSYNPISINNTGVADAFRVMVLDSIYHHYFGAAPSSLARKTDAVNRTWIVQEAITGGSIATIKVEWTAADELPGFNRNLSMLSQYVNPNWVVGNGMIASGVNPYTDTLSAVSDFSTFQVAFGVINGTNATSSVGTTISENGTYVLYPNPVTGDKLFVRFSNAGSDIHLRVSDMLGKVWSNTDANPINNTVAINVADLPAGIYILQVVDGSNNTVESIKFNKQ